MHRKRKKKFRFLRTLLLLTMIVCLIPVGQAYYLSFKHEKQQEKLRNILVKSTEKKEPEKEILKDTEIWEKLKNLYKENNDLIGWLTVNGTRIDYPVMQCEDDEYYLHHSFYKEKDTYGCLYVRSMADTNTPGTNFIIYGHNMRDGSMFGTLDDYRSESFYKDHTLISFSTLYEERTYEILSVFTSQIQDANAFPYYQFYQANTQEEFEDFYDNIKKLSLYDTEITAEFGDTFLTLSTCSNDTEDGRFVVVAKRRKSEK